MKPCGWVYTAMRVNAAAGARWEEFDLDKRIWIVPAARMKRRGQRKGSPVPRAIVQCRRQNYPVQV
jgi:integrase